MKPLKFTGYRGRAALVQIGEIGFIIVARNQEQLGILCSEIVPQAGPFNPNACQPVIVISSKTLPENK